MILMLALFCIPWAANAQQRLPYSYGFEDNDLATDGWTTQNPSGLNASEFGIIGTAAQTGDYGFRFSSYNDRGASTQYLISPELNAPRGVVVQFSYMASSGYTSGETFQVGYSTTDDNISSFTFGTANNATNTTWAQTEEILLPAGTKYVAVYYSANYQYHLYVDDFTFAEPPACIPATNLAVTNDGQTATVTWDGTAANNFIVTVNGGTPATGQTSPYTFNVDLSTTYEVVVMADCGADGTSDPVSTSFTTPDCLNGRVIEYTLEDSYGDGWNGNAIQVYEGCGNLIATLTIESGSSETGTLTLCGDYYEFIWVNGSYASETSFTFSEGGNTLFTKPSSVSDGLVLYTIGSQSCVKPTGLAESNITINSADLSWTGSSDSYMVEYTPWNPAGTDVLPTATMTTYTFPLNGTGTGNVVIRHYDVTNMFRLIVDDIVVKDANGNVIYSEDFETSGGSMPAEFTSVDMDGDGYGWEVVSNSQSYVNGSYGLSSASWTSNAGALFPDNWIILSGIQLGGSISFQARGQDPNFAAEKFCVYVCANADAQQESAASTSYTLGSVNPLTPFTPYSWSVKGICGNDESCPSFTNIFITLDDVMVFTTEGDWNDTANWDANRIPTADDKVRLDANATIGNGVVAYAKKIVSASTGTVTIKDGGQLKQSETAVVTIEKKILGYGEGNGNWNLITTPLTTTLFDQQTDWAYVDIMSSATYDLYSFNPAQELEWANFNNSANTSDDFTRLYNGQGYLYANAAGDTLHFTGSTAVKSLNNIVTEDFEYDGTSTDDWNGWKLVGNPFTCNGYINYVDANDNSLPFKMYVMNAEGNGFELATSNVLAPLTAALINVSTSGKIQYSSEPLEATISSSIDVPCLPAAHGETTDQNACEPTPACFKILVDETNTEWSEDFEGYDVTTTLPERWTGVLPTCWTVPVQYTGTTDTLPQVYQGFNTTDEGLYSLRMHFRYMLAMPELDENVDLGKLRMNLNVRQPYYAYKLQIGIITDMDNPETSFVPVAVVNNSGKNMTNFECGFTSVSDLVGAGRHIAFKNIGGSTNDLYCTNYLDDITLTYVNVDDLECEIYPDYTEDFEAYEVSAEPNCWEVITEDAALESTTRPQVYAGFNTTPSGSKSLRMKNRCVYAMPELLDYPISNFTMTFNLRQPKSIYRLQVGVVDEEGNFQALKTFKCPNTTDFEEMSVNFANFDLTGNRIAFRNTLVPGTGKRTDYLDYSINYIDDINFTYEARGRNESNAGAFEAEGSLEDIAVYPNPTTGNLYIDAIGIQKVECYNQMGQLVRVYDNVRNSIDLNNLSEGVYTLRITVPQGVTMRKVVKR